MKKLIILILLFLCFCYFFSYLFNRKKLSLIKIGTNSKPETLLPYKTSRSDAYRLLYFLYDNLCDVDYKNNVEISQMIELFQINKNEIILTLKKGIYFHKGTEATAIDVKYSLQQAIEANRYNIRASIFKTITNIEILDRYSLKIKLSAFYPPLLHDFVTVTLVHPPNEEVNGTGPFMLEKQNSNLLILKKNNQYFKKIPKSERIIFYHYENQHQLWRALLENKIDFADDLILEDFKNLKKNEKFQGYTYLGHLYFVIAFNHNDPLFSSKKVRIALNYAINKDKIIENYWGGYGVICKSSIFPESSAYNDNISSLSYNPQKTIQLLKEEGWELNTKTGLLQKGNKIFEFKLYFDREDQSKEIIANQIAIDLFEFGIRVKMQAVPRKDFVEKIFMDKEFQAVFIQFTGESPDASYNFWHSSQIENGFNCCSYKNSVVDQYLWLGRTTVDKEKQKNYYLKYQEAFINDPPGILLYYRYNFAIGRKNLKGIKSNMFGFFNNVEEWYLEK